MIAKNDDDIVKNEFLRALDVEVATADIVQGLIVDLVGDIGVLEERVDTQPNYTKSRFWSKYIVCRNKYDEFEIFSKFFFNTVL